MYEDYFGLKDLPFRITPEPHFLYNNPAYQKAYTALQDGIRARNGFLVITGEIGTGKTTLLTMFLQDHVDPSLQSAVILNPSFDFAGLLRFALHDLGIPSTSVDEVELLEQFRDYTVQEAAKGHHVVIFIDEAQTLGTDVLNDLVRLRHLAGGQDTLVQIVLIGQPELDEKLNQPALGRLKEELSIHARLAALTPEQIRGYIDFRLATAGHQGKPLFDATAIEKIILYSAGIPRLINIICDNALLIAFGLSKKKVSAAIIEEVAEDLQLGTRIQVEEVAPAAQVEIASSPMTYIESPRYPSFFQAEPRGGRFVNKYVASLALGSLVLVAFLVAAGSALYHRGTHLLSSMASGVFFKSDAHTPARVRSDPQVDRDTTHDRWPDFEQLKKDFTPIRLENKKPSAIQVAPAETAARNSEENTSATSLPVWPYPEEELPPPAPKKKPRLELPSTAMLTNVEPNRSGALITPSNFPDTPAGRPQYWPNVQTANISTRKVDREQFFFQGTFEVTADSLLFDQPQRESALLKTLRPGSHVRVEKKVGNFLVVRSLNDPAIYGYVHLDDAYFRRIR